MKHEPKRMVVFLVIFYADDMLSQDLQFAYPLEDRREQTQLIKWLKNTPHNKFYKYEYAENYPNTKKKLLSMFVLCIGGQY